MGARMYIIVVLAQTLVLPLISTIVAYRLGSGEYLLVLAAVWWAFWGVGTRLTLAGISQLARPEKTATEVLGIDAAEETRQIVSELAYANLSLGVVALFSPFVAGWGILGALPGAVYLGFAGFRHVVKRGKNRQELVATWTDLLVFAVVAAGLVTKALTAG